MPNVSSGDGFSATTYAILEGGKALFAPEQCRVLLEAEAALINDAVSM